MAKSNLLAHVHQQNLKKKYSSEDINPVEIMSQQGMDSNGFLPESMWNNLEEYEGRESFLAESQRSKKEEDAKRAAAGPNSQSQSGDAKSADGPPAVPKSGAHHRIRSTKSVLSIYATA